VVIVQHTSNWNKIDSPGYDVVDELDVEDSDYRISKTFCNSFWKTELEDLLKDLDVEFVVCSGFAAQHCVLFTYNGAKERGFKAAMLQNGVLGLEKKHAEQVQLLRDVISIDTLEYLLEKL